MTDSFENIKFKIQSFRQFLSKTDESICFANISSRFTGYIPLLDDKSLNDYHIEMLKIFDGGRFGMVNIWSVKDLPSQQFYLEQELLDGYVRDNQTLKDYFRRFELTDFYVFGQVFYEPILLNRITGDIAFAYDYNLPCQIKPLYDFIDENILGKKYAEFFVQNDEQIIDEWLDFVLQHL